MISTPRSAQCRDPGEQPSQGETNCICAAVSPCYEVHMSTERLLTWAIAGGILAGTSGCEAKAGGAASAEPTTASKTTAAAAASGSGGAKDCCVGKNECKGKGGCKTDKNECSGKNECKGKGGCRHRDCT